MITDKTKSLTNDKRSVFYVGDEIVTLNRHNLRGVITKMWECDDSYHYATVKFTDRDRLCRLNAIKPVN